MFRKTIDLSREKIKSLTKDIIGYPAQLNGSYTCGKLTIQIYHILHNHNLNPETILARGGFKSSEDVAMILETGWDYEGRKHKLGFKNVTYASPVKEMDRIHILDDPALNPIFWIIEPAQKMQHPALVFYDANQMKLSKDPVEAKLNAYKFLDPDKKRDALRGLIEFQIQ